MDKEIAGRSGLPRWGAVTVSCLVPGLGQFFVGRLVSGAAWFVAIIGGICAVFWAAASPRFPGLAPAFGLLGIVLVVWLLMLVHAYRCAPPSEDCTVNKSWVAAFLSDVLPGLGQFYNRQIIGGTLFLVGTILTCVLPEAGRLFAGSILQLWSPLNAFRFRSARLAASKGDVGFLVVALVVRVVLVLVAIFGIRTFLVQPFKVPTGTMAPTIRGITQDASGKTQEGDHILLDKLTYKFRAPRRGEIIVFRTDGIQLIPETSHGQYWVNRIVGLPGEQVSIRPPFLYINKQRVTEPPVLEKIQRQRGDYTGYVLPETLPAAKFLSKETDMVQLGDDQYFVLGDNSRSSLDSRFWGPLPARNIVGRVAKIYWPLDRMGITLAE